MNPGPGGEATRPIIPEGRLAPVAGDSGPAPDSRDVWIPLSTAADLLRLPDDETLALALDGILEGRMAGDREEVSARSIERFLAMKEALPSGALFRPSAGEAEPAANGTQAQRPASKVERVRDDSGRLIPRR